LTIRDCRLEVTIEGDAATYTLREGASLVLTHYDETITLELGVPVSRELPRG
jgi:hypothetical protein